MKLDIAWFQPEWVDLEVMVIDGEEFITPTAIAAYWMWEACHGNDQAVELVKYSGMISSPMAHMPTLIEKAKQGDIPSIHTAIRLVASGLDKKIHFEVIEKNK